MITLARIIAIAILSVFFTSCNFDFSSGIKGNRNVVSETREVNESFTTIKASEGLDVYITQASDAAIEVEADENVISLIATDIDNGTLRIHTEKNIGRCKSKKVYVRVPTIEKIVSTSGADVFSTATIVSDDLEVKSTSGADVQLEVKADNVYCSSSSGADIEISGVARSLVAKASSGSDIKAKDLEVEICDASASSGADVTVNVTEKLIANSSSGGDVNYYGNPDTVSKNKSVSGSVQKK